MQGKKNKLLKARLIQNVDMLGPNLPKLLLM